jgi:hypothetical protein
MLGQAAAGWDRLVPVDVPAVLLALRDLRVVLPGALVLRLALSAGGEDLESPRLEPT